MNKATPRQKLVSHLIDRHGEEPRPVGTHNQLALKHQEDHDNRRLSHKHREGGLVTGGDIINFKIYLSPPKNPGATRNGDRNWSLQLTTTTGGFRHELAGTSQDNPRGAKEAAATVLGWYPNWITIGWGFQHQEKVETA